MEYSFKSVTEWKLFSNFISLRRNIVLKVTGKVLPGLGILRIHSRMHDAIVRHYSSLPIACIKTSERRIV